MVGTASLAVSALANMCADDVLSEAVAQSKRLVPSVMEAITSLHKARRPRRVLLAMMRRRARATPRSGGANDAEIAQAAAARRENEVARSPVEVECVAGRAAVAAPFPRGNGEICAQMARPPLPTSADASLRYLTRCVALLANTTTKAVGVAAMLQTKEADGALLGLHVARLLEIFVRPPPRRVQRSNESADGDTNTGDALEHIASVLTNVTAVEEGRELLTDPSRGIIPKLLPQLNSPSLVRRRGVAGALRNCLFRTTAAKALLAEELGLATALLFPLVVSEVDAMHPEDKKGVPPQLLLAALHREREPDAGCLLVESLLLMAGTREGRVAQRAVKAYPIIREMHKKEDDEETGGDS